MPINLTFDNKINSLLQINDKVFAASTLGANTISDQLIYLGNVIELTEYTLTTDGMYYDPTPGGNPGDDDASIDYLNGHYIFFSKNVEINESSIKGYYADVTFVNNSNTMTELFCITAEVAPSSK